MRQTRRLVLVLDGQGGGMGAQLVKLLADRLPEDCRLLAVGTNVAATGAMLRAGASDGATGENAVVYNASRVFLPDGAVYAAVTNVGTRPTLDNGADVTVEACLLDFQGDLYGQTLRLEFFQHLRDEVRFDSLDALKAQIQRDVQSTRDYFTAHPELLH